MQASSERPVTAPFGFRRHLQSAPKVGFDFVPYLDILTILLVIGLNFSAFIATPGLEVRLIPTRAQVAPTLEPTVALTVGRNGMLIFNGVKVERDSLEQRLRAYTAGEGAAKILVVRADRRLGMEQLFGLFDLARASGFATVQLAGAWEPDAPTTWESAP